MLALAAAGLFFASFALALGTILHMVNTYGGRAIAALRLEHVPARTISRMEISSYSRIRPERSQRAHSIYVRRRLDIGSHAA